MNTTVKKVTAGKDNIHIHIHMDEVPQFAKNKKFHVKPGKVTSKYESSVFVPGVNFNQSAAAAAAGDSKSRISKASSQKEQSQFEQSITPPVDPKTLVEMRGWNAFHDRSIRLKTIATVYQGYDIRPNDEKDNDTYQDLPNYQKLKAFLDSPNQAGEDFIDILYGFGDDYYTNRYAYLECVSNSKGELAEIYNLRAPSVRVKKERGNIFFIQKDGSAEQKFALYNFNRAKRHKELNEVLWLRDYYSLSRYYAVPDYYGAVADITLDRSSVEYNISRFKNGLMVDFIIVVEGGEVDSKVLEDINSFLSKNYKGVLNAGKALYLNSDDPNVKIRIEKVSAEIKDASFLKQREFSREVVMVAHGMNAKIWGLATAGQLGSGEGDMMFRLFEEMIGKPDRQKFERKINKLIKYGLLIDDLHLELRSMTIEAFKDLVAGLALAPYITDDEKRIATGYAPLGEEAARPTEQLAKVHRELLNIKKQLTA